MDNSSAFIAFRKKLIEEYFKQQAYKQAKASGNFERYVRSDASASITANRYIQKGTEYTKEIDAGRSRGKIPPVQNIYDWLGLKKYGINYANDQQRTSIAWAIAKTMAKDGSYKRRTPSARTKITETAIKNSLPTLREALALNAEANIRSRVLDSINKINEGK